MKGRILAIGASDSGGADGIQADLKTVTALGGFCMTAITAIAAQNRFGVQAVELVSAAHVARQIAAVVGNTVPDAIKIGLVPGADMIDAVADTIEAKARGTPLVLDPVLGVKGGGDRLLDEAAYATLIRRLAILAKLITPNVTEAALLCGEPAVATLEEQRAAAAMLRTIGSEAVLVKGGLGADATVYDVLATEGGVEVFSAPRISGKRTRGKGGTLAAAIATGLAQGMPLRAAILRAREYVRRAIAAAPSYPSGRGPLDHGITVVPFDPH